MKYYKLICIKDLLDCEKGFSWTFSKRTLDDKINNYLFHDDVILNRKIKALYNYRDHKDFVETVIDLDYAIKELKCPCCNKESLFPIVSPEDYNYDDGVYDYYKEVKLVCGICNFSKSIVNVHTCTKVNNW